MQYLDAISKTTELSLFVSKATPGIGHGQGGLACCDSWGRKELDTTERLY